MSDFADEVFGPSGLLARRFPGYAVRDGQIAGTRFAKACFDHGGAAVLEAPTGCHVAGQGILMIDGSIKCVEDVVVGDELMGPDSLPRRVLALARGEQETVTIVPVKGEPWRVNLDHILTLVRTGSKKPGQRKDTKWGEVLDVSVREWLTWSTTQKHIHKLMRVGCRFRNRDSQPPLIAPYHLGILLGDGGLAGASIGVTKQDPEILQECRRLANRFGLKVRTSWSGCTPTHYFSGKIPGSRNPLIAEISRLGLRKRSGEKFIPHHYKVASVEDRLELLAGLIDTDGSLVSGGYEYVSKSEALARDVVFVARSLGVAAYVKSVRKRWQNVIGTYWRVVISGDLSRLPLRLQRKKIGKRLQIKEVTRTGFSVKWTGVSERYYGFTLSGDGRYLLDDFTVTHNTGKSLTALVPAIRSITENRGEMNNRAVVVTGTIALQEQLIQKDLPLLAQILPDRFTFAIAKGFGNYACRMAIEEARTADQTGELRLQLGYEELAQARQLLEWERRTETGDLSELPFEPPPRVRRLAVIQREDCIGKSCDHHESCYPRAARKSYQGADIVVTNYALYSIDLASRAGGARGPLPQHRLAILDECHSLSDAARQYFARRCSKGSVKGATDDLAASGKRAEKLGIPKAIDPELRQQIRDEADRFFAHARGVRDSKRYRARLDVAGMIDGLALEGAFERASLQYGIAASSPGLSAEAREYLARRQVSCTMQAALIREARGVEQDGWVYHLEERGQSVELVAEPVSAAPFLKRTLFAENDEPPHSVFMCSATVAEHPGDFKYFGDRIGLEPGTELETLAVPSPFDFTRTAIVVPGKGAAIPDPSAKRDEFEQYVSGVASELVQQTDGGVLCLFTSRRGVEAALRRVRADHPSRRVLGQWDAPRGALLKRMRDEPGTVLLGTSSLWEGVDLPGEALVSLLIDKLPFENVQDPVLDAIRQEDPRGYFDRYYVPRAVLDFKQGFGRLMRTIRDYGVVVVCDPRLTGKGYGRRFLRALPVGVRQFGDVAKVRTFLEEMRAQTAA